MQRWYFCAMALLFCSGCNETKDLLPTTKVDGNVSFQGSPLESGTITFFPVAGGKHAIGLIVKNGDFSLSTYETGDGAVLGQHKVVIDVPYEMPDGVPAPDSVPRIPTKYSKLETTPLIVDITSDGENKFPFTLEP